MTVLVTGASGTLGSAVVPRLQKQGYAVRPMTRSARTGWVTADLRTGDGLEEAVRGVAVIVHLASSPGRPQQTDVEGTRRLVAAARTAGVEHFLYVSINGIDRVPYRYYQAKLDTEAVVKASGIPCTILRAAQFHDFAEMLLSGLSRLGPVLIDGKWQLQTVAIEDVADRIAELIARPATGETTEYAGPQVLTFEELARSWLAAKGSKRPVWQVRLPGRMARAIRDGAQTTAAIPAGTRTWRDYLAAKY
ncbi:NmrA family transcriptional regulator [Paractinoplanes durhamensis]|uniref:NmrA family transcriptional regulator n=2 Tax=Paractinoplanes durhamensis TaxID=113563 RepID=A0ABQ3Z648_9ACTN|nr:NmrA family transcriptional regulator [Actinoplanes durhamensis]